MLSESVRQVVAAGVSGRVFSSCRSCGVREPARIAYYTRAVEQAVLAVLAGLDDPVGRFDGVLAGQTALLEAALQAQGSGARRHAAGCADQDAVPGSAVAEAPAPRRPEPAGHGAVPAPAAPPPSARGMEQKLQEARKPLCKLLREECVHLGLVTAERAEELVHGLAGRLREDAEADIVAELRNNLHHQMRAYIRQQKGGPWPTPKSQEELRLDIVATRSVSSLLTLARQLLRERTQWESRHKVGRVRSLLGGKLLLGLRRRT